MNIIINHSSMQPIYEQIMGQIKERIMHGELKEDTALPSVRTFAYDNLYAGDGEAVSYTHLTLPTIA